MSSSGIPIATASATIGSKTSAKNRSRRSPRSRFQPSALTNVPTPRRF
jgi:hypothetical protein